MVVLSLPVLAVVLGVVVWKVSFLFLVALSDDSFSSSFSRHGSAQLQSGSLSRASWLIGAVRSELLGRAAL